MAGRWRGRVWWPLFAVIGLVPVLVVSVLRLPLINQLNYADPWFYSAFAWAPKHQFAVFGWNYFAVRFPAILPIGVFERLFGVHFGYVLLRYVLAVLCGTALYGCARRFSSRRTACTTVVLLYLNPFFSRSLLWDYSSYLEIAAGVAGVASWYWSDSKRLRWTVLPGTALACAVFANAEFVTVLVPFFVVELVAAARSGRGALLWLARRIVVLATATAATFLVGYFAYLAILGSLSPLDLLRPTVKYLFENSKLSAPYQHPVGEWLLHEPRIWAPVIVSLALVATLRQRLFSTDLVARIAQFCVFATAFLWLFRFTVTSSVIETWWSYDVLVVAIAPAAGILVSELNGAKPTSRVWPLLAAIALAASLVFIRDFPHPAETVYRELATHEALLGVMVAIGVTACALAARRSFGGVSLLLFAVVLSFMFYAPSVLDGRAGTGLFVRSGSTEWAAYAGGKRFLDLIRDYDNPAHRVFLWYPGLLGYVSLAWLDLPQDADTLNDVGVPEPVSHLTPLGIARFRQPQVAYVMVLAPQAGELVTARNALADAGFGSTVVRSGWLVEKKLGFELIAR